MADVPKYQGPDETVVALGQSSYDSMIGSVAGAAAGAAAGALAHNESTTKAIKAASNTKSFALASEAGKARVTASGALEAAEKVLEENKGIRRLWNEMGRGSKALVGALAGAAIVSSITQMTGFFRGSKKAQAGRQQFDELVAENQALKGRADAAEARLTDQKSFVNALEKERTAPTRSNERS